MNKDPLERELEFRRSIEEAARTRRETRPGRRMVGVIGSVLSAIGRRAGLFLILTIFAVVVAFFIVVFGLIIKWTDAYACSMDAVRKNPVIVTEVGEPVEGGFFAWSFSYRQEGGTTDTYFTTGVSGPKGDGTLRVQFYRSPVGWALNMDLEKDGRTQIAHRGPTVCP